MFFLSTYPKKININCNLTRGIILFWPLCHWFVSVSRMVFSDAGQNYVEGSVPVSGSNTGTGSGSGNGYGNNSTSSNIAIDYLWTLGLTFVVIFSRY